jgi:hypothetical protein
MTAEELVKTADGRVWLAGSIRRKKDPVMKQQGLEWLSYALQREVTFDTLDQVA